MARREHQMSNVLRHDGPRPYWYIRYRRKVVRNHLLPSFVVRESSRVLKNSGNRSLMVAALNQLD